LVVDERFARRLAPSLTTRDRNRYASPELADFRDKSMKTRDVG
jgi:hypothetical protein